MSMKSRILASVGGVGLTLAVAVTAITAGGPIGGSAAPASSPSASPVASSAPVTRTVNTAAAFPFSDFGSFSANAGAGPMGLAGVAMAGMGDPAQCQDVKSKLAANLGVTTKQLEDAIKQTLIQEIDEAEQSGKLTADQAKTARDRINSATDLCAGFGLHVSGPAGQRPAAGQGRGSGHTFAMFDGAAYEAVAKYFGITVEQLRQDATDLGSLKAVAAKYNKDNDTGKAGLKAEIEKALKADLTQRGVPQEMIDRVVSGFSDNFDSLYTAEIGKGMPFGPGKRGPRTSPSPSPTSQTQ